MVFYMKRSSTLEMENDEFYSSKWKCFVILEEWKGFKSEDEVN